MAVVVTMDQTGDTQELLKKYDIVNAAMQSAPALPAGLLAHFCVETPGGIRVSNVFDSEASAKEGSTNPVLRDALAKAEMQPVEPSFERVYKHFITSELKAPA